jgi:hypothetical protein
MTFFGSPVSGKRSSDRSREIRRTVLALSCQAEQGTFRCRMILRFVREYYVAIKEFYSSQRLTIFEANEGCSGPVYASLLTAGTGRNSRRDLEV